MVFKLDAAPSCGRLTRRQGRLYVIPGAGCDYGTAWTPPSASSGGSMSSAMRSMVTLHVVSSLDGFIAKKDNSVSWMDSSGDVYERGVTDDGADVIESIDCYVLGS